MDTKLAKSLVEHKRWRWMPRMHGLQYGAGQTYLHSETPAQYGHESYNVHHWHDDGGAWMRLDEAQHHEVLPDLDDPATVGCLMSLLVEAANGDGQLLGELLGSELACVDGEAVAKALLIAWRL